LIRRVVRAVDERVGSAPWARRALRHAFPDHWSFMLGEVALYAFVILVVTGLYLTLFFDPGLTRTVYDGSYVPLRGTPVSAAYESVMHLSFDVRAGLLFRQMHHWAALVFLAAITVHAGRVFFTGAFRKPRDLNWMVGVTMLVLALGNGFLGYSLLDDLLSGIGLRIAYSLAESIPFVGTWVASLAFGGEFPTDDYLRRFYILHVLVVPALLATLIGVHLVLIWRQKHTQFPSRGASERTVVGSPLYPTYMVKSLSLFFGLFAVIALLGGVAQINPVWLWGPYEPSAVTTAAQPDWYVGWLEGALRLFPPWEVRAGGFMVANPFFPAVLMPALFFLVLYAYPALERRFSGDRDDHELLDAPRFHPVRTGLGVAALTYFVVLLVAGSQDVLAQHMHISVQRMVLGLRIAVLALPILTGLTAWLWCRQLARATTGPVPVREAVHEAWTEAGTVGGPAPGPDGEGGGTPVVGGRTAEPPEAELPSRIVR
jgi:ubiquinol-cytochrome c reductase cytochrome b subunit